MRFAVAITVALLIACMVIPASGAPSETGWRMFFRCDDGTGSYFGAASQIGVIPNSVDGPDGEDLVRDFVFDFPKICRYVDSVLPGDTTHTYVKNIKSPAPPWTYPQNRKVWDLRLGALVNATSAPIRLQMRSSVVNPSPTIGGVPFSFELVMVDNKGIAGAAPNGTRWSVPIPTGGNGDLFWSMDTAADQNGIVWGNLPMLKLSSETHAAMRAEGYQMQFVQTAVPEPSSVMALSAGLIGLMGFARRRRR